MRAGDGPITRRRISIENERPSVSTRPISNAAMNAPRIEPMPPITITTKARMRMFVPMPGSTEMIGAIMMPAKPASMVPKPNTNMNSRSMLTPSAETMRRIGGAGAHQHADPRVGHQHVKADRDRRGRRR